MDKLAVVIATHGRPDTLKSVLEGVFASNTKPLKVVTVDSSDSAGSKRNQALVHQLQKAGLPVEYIGTECKSANVQRNLGVSSLKLEDYDFVQILDDDTIPSMDYFELLIGEFKKDNSLVGMSGTTRSITKLPSLMKKVRSLPFVLVGLESYQYGKISLAGVGMPPSPEWKVPTEVEWLFGCSMWRSEIFRVQRFENSFVGSCLFDDVLFSLQASKNGVLKVHPEAYLHHLLSQESRPSLTLHYYRFSRNRALVIRELDQLVSYVMYPISVLFLGIHFVLRSLWPFEDEKSELFSCGRATFSGYLDFLKLREPK